jgi:hypothetical protein
MHVRRILVAIALMSGAALVGTVPAAATPAPPPSPPTLLPGTSTAHGDGYCPFPVQVTTLRNNEHSQISTLPDGTVIQHVEGNVVLQLANLDTGQEVTYNASGNGMITIPPNAGAAFSLDVQGPNVLWTTVTNSFPGVPQITFTTGHLDVNVDASGLTTSWSGTGPVTDVCAVLGA